VHALLALLVGKSVASETLVELGVTYDAVSEHLARWQDSSDADGEEVRGVSPTPEMYGLMGRAEGFAASDGVVRPTPEHVLIALVWNEHSSAVALLHNMGATQIAVLDGLRARGVHVPVIDPPLHRPWRQMQEVEVAEAELQALIDALRAAHPVGSDLRWGFNWTHDEPRRARVVAEDGIDLDEALRRSRQAS
jgi:hypothetical protein